MAPPTTIQRASKTKSASWETIKFLLMLPGRLQVFQIVDAAATNAAIVMTAGIILYDATPESGCFAPLISWAENQNTRLVIIVATTAISTTIEAIYVPTNFLQQYLHKKSTNKLPVIMDDLKTPLYYKIIAATRISLSYMRTGRNMILEGMFNEAMFFKLLSSWMDNLGDSTKTGLAFFLPQPWIIYNVLTHAESYTVSPALLRKIILWLQGKQNQQESRITTTARKITPDSILKLKNWLQELIAKFFELKFIPRPSLISHALVIGSWPTITTTYLRYILSQLCSPLTPEEISSSSFDSSSTTNLTNSALGLVTQHYPSWIVRNVFENTPITLETISNSSSSIAHLVSSGSEQASTPILTIINISSYIGIPLLFLTFFLTSMLTNKIPKVVHETEKKPRPSDQKNKKDAAKKTYSSWRADIFLGILAKGLVTLLLTFIGLMNLAVLFMYINQKQRVVDVPNWFVAIASFLAFMMSLNSAYVLLTACKREVKELQRIFNDENGIKTEISLEADEGKKDRNTEGQSLSQKFTIAARSVRAAFFGYLPAGSLLSSTSTTQTIIIEGDDEKHSQEMQEIPEKETDSDIESGQDEEAMEPNTKEDNKDSPLLERQTRGDASNSKAHSGTCAIL